MEENKMTPAENETADLQDNAEFKTAVGNVADDLRSAGGAMADEYRAKGEQAWEDARDRVRTFQEDSQQYLRENPMKTVFAALGIGFVLGLMFRR